MSNICGYIYIFFNPAMCGLVKIGFASDVEQLASGGGDLI